MTIIFGFFGFYRNGQKYSYNFDIKSSSYKKYIYTPSILNEDTTNLVYRDNLIEKFGEDTKISIYEYDKLIYIDESRKYSTDKFINNFFQQGYRIFSFFYNIKEVSKLIKNDNYNADDIIIISRIDIGLSITDENKILELLIDNDVIVTDRGNNYVDDKVFIFKYKYIDVFINLYKDYGLYITKIKNNTPDKPISSRPEDIFFYHFTRYNLKIIGSKLISYQFNHVCSLYCGHNGNNTKT